MSTAETRITLRIAEEIGCKKEQVMAAVALLDEGATVPFIARYRKEVTGGLDDTQLRTLDERLVYLRELEDRRAAILASIDEQGKLTPELAAEIAAAETKQGLEDLYLPYKPKRRTKAQIAREAGIAPLAEALLADPTLSPEAEAEKYLNAEAGFAEVKAVLDGARQILMEKFSEDATLLGSLREYLERHGVVKSTVVEGKTDEGRSSAITTIITRPSAKSPRTGRWRFCADATKASCNWRWCLIRSWKPPPRRPTPAKRASPNTLPLPIRAVRPTNGWLTRCAGPGASRFSCTLNWT